MDVDERTRVVDDDELLAKLLARALGREHEVTVVTSAREGLARVEAGERFDLILCDRMLPGPVGDGVLRARGRGRARTRRADFDHSLPGDWYRVAHGDYTDTGYDRGHLVRSEDRTSSDAASASTFLLTNVLP